MVNVNVRNLLGLLLQEVQQLYYLVVFLRFMGTLFSTAPLTKQDTRYIVFQHIHQYLKCVVLLSWKALAAHHLLIHTFVCCLRNLKRCSRNTAGALDPNTRSPFAVPPYSPWLNICVTYLHLLPHSFCKNCPEFAPTCQSNFIMLLVRSTWHNPGM